MTQNETIKAIRDMGLACRVQDGEFRVAYRVRDNEASACYTTDREDALDTAKAMVKQSLVVEA